jgi:hypothetical protein
MSRPETGGLEAVTTGPVDECEVKVDRNGSRLASTTPSARTGPQCRLACITNDQCQAFTFIKRKKECWLKSSVGEARYKPGMVSGGKKLATFSPTSVIALE